MNQIEQFFDIFVRPPHGKSPDAILAKLRHHIDVANHADQYVSDKSTFAIRAKRRNALQAIRRLVQRHPALAAQMIHGTDTVSK